MSYLHKPFWQDVLKKSTDKFHGVKGDGFPCFLVTIFILKFNDIVFNACDAVIGDSDAEHIPREVSERVLSFSHSLTMCDPFLFPKAGIDFIEELGLFHRIPEFGFKDMCEGFCVNKQILS